MKNRSCRSRPVIRLALLVCCLTPLSFTLHGEPPESARAPAESPGAAAKPVVIEALDAAGLEALLHAEGEELRDVMLDYLRSLETDDPQELQEARAAFYEANRELFEERHALQIYLGELRRLEAEGRAAPAARRAALGRSFARAARPR